MTTNRQKMTLEERITQTLKDDTLMKLVGDEDAIRELVERAIRKELFEDRLVPSPNSYGGATKEPSAVVKAAREAAQKVADRIADQYIDEIMELPSMKDAMREVVPNLIVGALGRKAEMIWDKYRDQTSMDAAERLRRAMGG